MNGNYRNRTITHRGNSASITTMGRDEFGRMRYRVTALFQDQPREIRPGVFSGGGKYNQCFEIGQIDAMEFPGPRGGNLRRFVAYSYTGREAMYRTAEEAVVEMLNEWADLDVTSSPNDSGISAQERMT